MITFLLNDTHVTTDLNPGMPLLDFLRSHKRLVGTKIGCREGDCGACTVIIGEIVDGKLLYRTQTSCLTPLGNAKNKHIVTIEGLNMDSLSPIQKAFLDQGSAQCGFCTAGFIVAFSAFFLSGKEVNLENGLAAIDGNICRCTGYKAIERAVETCVNDLAGINRDNAISWLVQKSYIPAYFKDIETKLKAVVNDNKIDETVDFDPDNLIIGGGTDLVVQQPFEVYDKPLNMVFDKQKYKKIEIKDGKCHIGCAVTVTDLRESDIIQKMIPTIYSYTKLVSSTHIRNMSTLAGNMANGSPIGDLSIMFIALEAKLHLKSKEGARQIGLKDFFKGYKKVDLNPGEIIEEIVFDVPEKGTHFNFEKVSKRVHLDMATVNSAMCVTVKKGKISNATMAVGGLGPSIRYLHKTNNYLVGKEITDQTFVEANRIAQSEITPRSRPEYKRLLVKQFLFIHLQKASPSTLTLEALQ